MSSNKGFSDDELNDAKPWDLPFVEQPEKPQDKDKTNALNFRSDWKYEPPEEEEAPIDGKTVEFKWDTYHEDTMADLSDDLDDEDWDEDEYDVEVEYRK